MASIHPLDSDLYFGLSELDLLPQAEILLPRGITLRSCYAHLMMPLIMAFAPAPPGKPHPGPWKETRGSDGLDITAQLHIPESAGATPAERRDLASTIVFMIRLWTDPAVTSVAVSNLPFTEIGTAANAVAHIARLEPKRRYRLEAVDKSLVVTNLAWVGDKLEVALGLMKSSPEFRLAASALDDGHFVENTALALISIWGAIEAIFSPSSSELRFRVSSLVAAFLSQPGEQRLELQKEIAKLYDLRSAAAHGKPVMRLMTCCDPSNFSDASSFASFETRKSHRKTTLNDFSLELRSRSPPRQRCPSLTGQRSRCL